MEQVVQEFKAGSNDPEPQIRTAEVGATSEACKCSERSSKADTDCRTDDDVVLHRCLPPSSGSSFLTVPSWRALCTSSVHLADYQCDLLAMYYKRLLSGLISGCSVAICCFWYAVRRRVNT